MPAIANERTQLATLARQHHLWASQGSDFSSTMPVESNWVVNSGCPQALKASGHYGNSRQNTTEGEL
ncbi:yciV [Escherichia coli O25b:H4]|uniref:YciV n=1 Tax=Escherichia coli O25b:H4 TaxID=941280 RepID=A0A192CN73_ECO25|nr:yciV [Escherichia coli O25b:H4]